MSPSGWSPTFAFPVATWDSRIAAFQAYAFNGGTEIWLFDDDITYSFPRAGSVWAGGLSYGGGELSAWVPFNESQKEAARKALALWAAVADITFREVPDNATEVGDIRFAFTYKLADAEAGGYAYRVSETPEAGDIWMDADDSHKRFYSVGDVWDMGPLRTPQPPRAYFSETEGYAFMTLLHEIGHALGLSHPFTTEGQSRATPALPLDEQNQSFSVMTYSDNYIDFAETPMPYDILAIQWLYGMNMNFNTGDNTYEFDISDWNRLTIWDAGGTDTIAATDVAGWGQYTSGVVIDLRMGIDADQINDIHNRWYLSESGGAAVLPNFELPEGGGSRMGWREPLHTGPNGAANVFIAYYTWIENAIGLAGKSDTLIGNSLRNVLSGRGGSDYIDGNGDIDTAVFEQPRSAYSISKDSAGRLVVEGGAGTDVLADIERLKFADGYLAFDIAGNAGNAFRLYKAAFDRLPDVAGLGYQTNELDNNVSLRQVASNFIASPEFQAKYGQVTDTQFVTLLYRNVLDREPDAGGLAYHLADLSKGAIRADILVNFSQSPENQANVIGAIQDGMFYTLG